MEQLSPDMLLDSIEPLRTLGLRSVLLFGIPDRKSADGASAWDPDGPVPTALRLLRERAPELVLIADVCLCEYTDHGHCGPVAKTARGESTVDNDAALPLHARAAVAYARAGADIVAPSGMIDGLVGALRVGLDAEGFQETAIMGYTAKYASAFYGPFRSAAESGAREGDRRTYQMDPANGREALLEADLDAAEGADILMVKPALPCLDVVAALKRRVDRPVAAYQVSGEYAMLIAAIERGWLDRSAIFETILSIKRAGSDMIISYFTSEILSVMKARG